MEHHFALQGGGGVIEVQNHIFGTVDGLEGFFDQMFTGLHQHLDGHVVRDHISFDQGAQNFVFRFRGGGEAYFDFLEANIHQRLEIFQLFFQIHGVDQGLVAIAQIHAAPDGGMVDYLVRPSAVGNVFRMERNVFFAAFVHHDKKLLSGGMKKTPPTVSVRGVY